MAKGQVRGNREVKKPKQDKKLSTPASSGAPAARPSVVPTVPKKK